MHKIHFILIGILFGVTVLSGCGETSANYTFNRHIKFCKSMAGDQRVTGFKAMKVVDKCMHSKGHEDFSYAEYLKENPPPEEK